MVHNTIYISVHIYDVMLIGFTTICIYNKSYEGKCREQDREKHTGKCVYLQLNTIVPVTQDIFPRLNIHVAIWLRVQPSGRTRNQCTT